MSATTRGKGKSSARKPGLPDEDDDLAQMQALANQAFPGRSTAPAPPSAPETEEEEPAPSPAAAGDGGQDDQQDVAASPEDPESRKDNGEPEPGPGLQGRAEKKEPAPSDSGAEGSTGTRPHDSSGEDDEDLVGAGTDDEMAFADEPGSLIDMIKQSTVSVDAGVSQRFKQFQRSGNPPPANADVIFQALNDARGRYRSIIEALKPQVPEGQLFGRPVAGRRSPGTRLTTQINFRPTVGEERLIKSLARQSGAASMSAFVNAVLDDFLPPLKKKRS